MFHIGDQTSVERHQQRTSAVVSGRIGQVESAENSERRLATSSGAEHHSMAIGWEVQDLSLPPDWFR